MTVEQLIHLLVSVKNKKQEVVINANGEAIKIINIDESDRKVWIES